MIKSNTNNNKIIPLRNNSLVNNPPGEIFKLDDSKLLKLTGEMIQTGQVKTTPGISLENLCLLLTLKNYSLLILIC